MEPDEAVSRFDSKQAVAFVLTIGIKPARTALPCAKILNATKS